MKILALYISLPVAAVVDVSDECLQYVAAQEIWFSSVIEIKSETFIADHRNPVRPLCGGRRSDFRAGTPLSTVKTAVTFLNANVLNG